MLMSLLFNNDAFRYAIVVLVIAASTYLLLQRKRQAAAMSEMNIVQKELQEAGGLIPYLRKMHGERSTVDERLPMPNAMSTVDPAIMKAALMIADRPSDMFQFLDPIIGKHNLQSFPPDQALRLRKIIGPAFTPEAVEMKYRAILDIALEFVQKWERQAEEKARENVILMQREGLSLSIRLSVKALLRLDASNVDMKEFQERYDKVLDGLYDQQFSYLSPDREVEVQRNLPYVKEFVARSVRSHVNARRDGTYEKQSARDLIEIMLEENDPETGEPFSDDMIPKMISVFLIGAYHTTGVSVAWTLCYVAQEPTVQARLQNEIDKVLQGRVPTMQDITRMEYLGQVVKESLRINPPGAFAARMVPKPIIARTSADDVITIKPGTTLMVPLSVLHEHSFKNPERFDPDRFSPNAGEEVARFGYSPFGYGVRMCPGERLAVMEIKLMLCLVMQKFDIELACDKDKIVRMERFVVMAKNDMPIRMTKRKVTAV